MGDKKRKSMSARITFDSVHLEIDGNVIPDATIEIASAEMARAFQEGIEAELFKPPADTGHLRESIALDSRPYVRSGIPSASPFGIVSSRPRPLPTSTISDMPSKTLDKETLDEVIEMLRMSPAERGLSREMREALAGIGLHEEMVKKLQFVLKKKAGVEALFKLTPRQIVDAETVVQTLLKVYDEVVSGE